MALDLITKPTDQLTPEELADRALVQRGLIQAQTNYYGSTWDTIQGRPDPDALAEYQKQLTRESGVPIDAPLQAPLKPLHEILREEGLLAQAS